MQAEVLYKFGFEKCQLKKQNAKVPAERRKGNLFFFY